jgi:hypothetical protein
MIKLFFWSMSSKALFNICFPLYVVVPRQVVLTLKVFYVAATTAHRGYAKLYYFNWAFSV